MNMDEKCELLKESIRRLYCDENKSKAYICRLLDIKRNDLNRKITEWGMERQQKKMSIATTKLRDQYGEQILSMLRNDMLAKEIASTIGMDYDRLLFIIRNTPVLQTEKEKQKERLHNRFLEREKSCSKLVRDFENYQGEQWRDILGYPKYRISNYGRVKSYDAKYDSFHLVQQHPNTLTGRMYVCVHGKTKRQNLSVHRLVAFAFCDGYSDERNTVNHIDGNVQNNHASNLEWVSQSDNLKHAYDSLGRPHNAGKPIKYIIQYQNQYSFKTVAAFARFANISETTARRWIDKPEQHQITLIAK